MKLPGSISRFLITGGLAAFAELLVFILMTKGLDQPLLISQSISFMTGFLISFYLNKTWVFGSRGKVHGELLSYALLAVVNLVISALAISALVSWGLPDYISKVILMGMIASWNYVLFRKVIFNSSLHRRKEQ